jgi:hypothetical protein
MRTRPLPPAASPVASPPAYDSEAASSLDDLSSAPPVDVGRPSPVPEPVYTAPAPAQKPPPVATSYYPPQPPTDLAVPSQAPTSILPSRAPIATPAPKRRGMQIAIVVVLLVLASVFVIALMMLKR